MSLLQIKNIQKKYSTKQGEIEALKDVTLTINKGEILSLLGVNGAGKSTLSGIIATLHPATSGDILFKGESIYKNIESFRAQIGFCPQKPNLKSMLTLEQNLVFAGRYYGLPDDLIHTRIKDLAKQFELEKYLQQSASILSGGYKQRFMIARSLIHNPELIILDEPTVGLDPHIRRALWDVIKELKNQGITVLLTTHYLDEAEKLSDRVCILDKGKIQLIDTPDKLMAQFQQTNLEDVFIELLKAGKHE
ncbi:ABC transporter ATP-binding protein [Candidatus Babeliales bacterium]|nr:ABC transporter ATP-binding protein [Candidatus Babeliales bacterium]MBP9844043.1 ABC transporter ATP-binding protein [Candidatus Babeliales bacterium]